MIELVKLTKAFGNKVAVDNLSLRIEEGELFAFLGPNAAGKTTTIKMLTGLLKPTSGTASINGLDIQTDHIMAKKQISYVPDVPYLYDKLTGTEFLHFVGDMYAIPKECVVEKTQSLLEMFDLTEYEHSLTETYSHGLRQRLVFCAALLHDPRVLIIDEPMVGLDPKSVKLVKEVLKQKAQEGCTIFMSTHTLFLAEELADRIGIIDCGQLIACGTMKELYKESGAHKAQLEDVFIRLTEEKNKT